MFGDVLDYLSIYVELLGKVCVELKGHPEFVVSEGDISGVLANGIEDQLLLGEVKMLLVTEGLLVSMSILVQVSGVVWSAWLSLKDEHQD